VIRRIVLIGLVLLLSSMIYRAAAMRSIRAEVQPIAQVALDEDSILLRLQRGIHHRTVSHEAGQGTDFAELVAFQAHLMQSYPAVYAQLELERVSEHSLLFRWAGRDPKLPALLLLAHQDVVPIDEGTEGAWTHPPFEAVISEGFVWGRGAVDDKFSLFMILEAVEGLLSEGFAPERTLYLSFGHDEEVGGDDGAMKVATLFAQRGIELYLVLDEGGAVVESALPGIDEPVALVGVAEKGYMSVLLEAESAGGHSSMPPAESTIGILAAAISRLEQNPLPTRLGDVTRALFERGIGPESSFGARLILANLYLVEPLLPLLADQAPTLGAMLRTTTAPTIFRAGTKDNVLPALGRAVVNFRILPGDTTQQVLDYVTEVVDDSRIQISVYADRNAPSPPSRMDSKAFETLARTIQEIYPETIVAPYLLFAGTDSRNFREICDCVYRFVPLLTTPGEMRRAHGTDERLPVAALAPAVRFYRRLIENASVVGVGGTGAQR
jgi:carboxypeptidase PM20D1